MRGLLEIVVSVLDLDRAAAPFCELGGYWRTALPEVSIPQRAQWHVPEACTHVEDHRLALPGEKCGAIRLIKFHGVEQQFIRPSARPWNTGGIASFDVWSRDCRGLFDRLQRAYGWHSQGEPVDFTMGPYDLTEVMALGSDGIGLSILTPRAAGDFDMTYLSMSRVFNIVQMVRDVDAAANFFEKILGWNQLNKADLAGSAEPGIQSVGLPYPQGRDEPRPLAMYLSHGPSDGGCEIMALPTMRGLDYATNAVAPNIGPLIARFGVDDARAFAEQIRTKGWRFYAEPARMLIEPYGQTWTCSVQSPDGAIFEFLSPA